MANQHLARPYILDKHGERKIDSKKGIAMKETKMRDEFEIIKSITRINGEINKLFTAKEFLLKALSTIHPPGDEEATPAPEKKRGRKPKALGKGIKPPMGTEDLEKRQKSAVAQQVEDHYFGDTVQKPFSK